MSKANAMTNEELVAGYQSGKLYLLDVLINKNMNLVRKYAHKYKIPGVEFEDRMQDGLMGLAKAAEIFKPECGYKFSTYAVPSIRGYMLREGTEQSNTVHVPVSVVEVRIAVQRFVKEYINDTGKRPTIAIIADELDSTEKYIRSVLLSENTGQTSSLDFVMSSDEGEGSSIQDFIGGEELESFTERQARHKTLKRFIPELCDVDQVIVKRVLGLDGYRSYLFSELDSKVANEYGALMSTQTIYQRYNKAAEYLAHRCAGGAKRKMFIVDKPKKNNDLRDIVLLISKKLKLAHISTSLSHSQELPTKLKGLFLNTQESFELANADDAVAFHFVKDVHRDSLLTKLASAISQIQKMGLTLNNPEIAEVLEQI